MVNDVVPKSVWMYQLILILNPPLQNYEKKGSKAALWSTLASYVLRKADG